MWILIVVLLNLDATPKQVYSVEFTSQKNCEKAGEVFTFMAPTGANFSCIQK